MPIAEEITVDKKKKDKTKKGPFEVEEIESESEDEEIGANVGEEGDEKKAKKK